MINQSTGKQASEAVMVMIRVLAVRFVGTGGFLRIEQVLKVVPKPRQQDIGGRKRALRMNQQMPRVNRGSERRRMGMLTRRVVMMRRRRRVKFLASVDVRPAFPTVLDQPV